MRLGPLIITTLSRLTICSIAWWWCYGLHVGLFMQVEWIGVVGASVICVMIRDGIDAIATEVATMIGGR